MNKSSHLENLHVSIGSNPWNVADHKNGVLYFGMQSQQEAKLVCDLIVRTGYCSPIIYVWPGDCACNEDEIDEFLSFQPLNYYQLRIMRHDQQDHPTDKIFPANEFTRVGYFKPFPQTDCWEVVDAIRHDRYTGLKSEKDAWHLTTILSKRPIDLDTIYLWENGAFCGPEALDHYRQNHGDNYRAVQLTRTTLNGGVIPF